MNKPALVVVAALAIGCHTVDVASRHTGPPPKCEIHGKDMTPELIYVSPGEAVYLGGYPQYAEGHFPHHGVSILSGEREFSQNAFETRVRDFVCSDCTDAWDAYWREWRVAHPSYRK